MRLLTSSYKLQKNLGNIVVWSIICWVIFTFLIYPNISLIKITLFSSGSFDFAPIKQIFNSERVRASMLNSFILGLSLSLTVNILGIFQILCLDYFEIKGRKWLNIAYYSPLVCNGMVLVMAYNFILGSRGFVTTNLMKVFSDFDPLWFQGYGAVLIEMTFAGTANHIMFVRKALKNIDFQTIEAAQNMGVKSHRILMKVALPTLTPAIFAASILSFIIGMSAFATPQVLGGEKFETINPLIFSFSNTLTTRNYAAVLAFFLGIVTVIVLLISNHIEKKRNYRSVSKSKTPLLRQKIQNSAIRNLITAFAHIVALIQTIPLLVIIIFSFMPVKDLYSGIFNLGNLTVEHYLNVFNSITGIQPVFTSIIYATLASVVVVSIILFLARLITKNQNKSSTYLELFLQIPWFLPSTLIALGLVMSFSQPSIFTFGNVWSGTLYLLFIGYVIVRIPYTLRMIKSAYIGLDGALEEAAKNLGASSVKTYFKVLLPILSPTAISVVLLNFIGLLAEYNASVFLFHPLHQPLGVVINAANSPTAFPETQMLSFVYSVIIMVVSTTIISLVQGREIFSKNKKL